MTLEELYASGRLSTRSMNICRSAGLINLELIIDHHYKFRTFLGIRGCGTDSNSKLICLCEQYDARSIQLPELNNDYVMDPSIGVKTLGKIAALQQMDWQNITTQAMAVISRPCTIKEISEYIGGQYESILMSRIHIQVKQCIVWGIGAGHIGTIPKMKQKYFLK